MTSYILVLAAFGALVLLTAWLPMLLREAPLSLPIVCVAIGMALFWLPALRGAMPHPGEHATIVEHVSELVVIISLMGAGLKIDRPAGFRSWRVTWRLLAFAMPLTIAAIVILGHWLLGLGVATALLLAASLAPTDPVLASDVQVGPPQTGEEDETRFALTSEAGLNDSLAFPFVMAAIALSKAGESGAAWFWQWAAVDVVWRLACGVAIGLAAGAALGWLLFHMPNRARLSRTGDGFVALGVTCLVYAVTEMVHGYGFVAVFVSALAMRATERNHHYHEKLHDFAEQLERLLMMVVLVMLGGMVTSGELLRGLTWQAVAFAVIVVFLVRPIAAWVSLSRVGCPASERAVISFFGIRGIGSIYYLAYALTRGVFAEPDLLWSTLGLVILISILIHGATVTPVMRFLDRRMAEGTTEREALAMGSDLAGVRTGDSPPQGQPRADNRVH
ncbi:cation:proton antiporter [Microvirga antarctica]|uniref:cation:proton antiporter n=1 Tax=Microvirga antarctica TaxID=2819233 RepID=UPI001B309CB2|nr:cation:proton antiporter [Microvirga antarctica]